MRFRRLSAIAAVTAVSAGLATPAYGHPQSPQAIQNCEQNVDKQSEKGTAAGGGPKEGVPAPTNCDHFFFAEGDIGQPHSGGPEAPGGPN